MADLSPGKDHRGAFTRGWKAALAVLSHERKAYEKPHKNTWQAIGYRHGLQSGILDEDEMERAWAWSIEELRRTGKVDEMKFK